MAEELTPKGIVSVILQSMKDCADVKVMPTSLDQKLKDLGMDSMAMIELSFEVGTRLDKITGKSEEIEIHKIKTETGVTVRDVVQLAAIRYMGVYKPSDYNNSMLS